VIPSELSFRAIPYKIVPAREARQSPAVVRSFGRTYPAAWCLSTGPHRLGQVDQPWPRSWTWSNTTHAYHIMTVEDPIEFRPITHKRCGRQTSAKVGGGHPSRSPTALKTRFCARTPDVNPGRRNAGPSRTISTAADGGRDPATWLFGTLHNPGPPRRSIDPRDRRVPPPTSNSRYGVQLALCPAGDRHPSSCWPKAGGPRSRRPPARCSSSPPAVRNLIREGKVHQIYSAMAGGAGNSVCRRWTSRWAELVRAGNGGHGRGPRALPPRG